MKTTYTNKQVSPEAAVLTLRECWAKDADPGQVLNWCEREFGRGTLTMTPMGWSFRPHRPRKADSGTQAI